jgi:ubiquinone/menaquinone biosynthesis C-methylase UbiE
MKAFDAETAVKERYAAAARNPEQALCCPVDYAPEFLKVIPPEVIEKDYGCGNPSRYLEAGETVLDLGSGSGKICFIAAQVVGRAGRVIGVDITDEMLAVARRNAPLVAEKLGYANVEFRKGRIQDLSLDLEKAQARLSAHPIDNIDKLFEYQIWAREMRSSSPLIASDSIDVVVSNCVLNLVDGAAKKELFGEIFRVLKPGGRAVISDIVASDEVPPEMQKKPELWTGCISGAMTEAAFLNAFKQAGLYGVGILNRNDQPWRTVEGIEFRSITVRAFKRAPGDLEDPLLAQLNCCIEEKCCC